PGVSVMRAAAGDDQHFVIIERFHAAISVVTMIGSTAFLLALMVIRADERREVAGVLRLLGLRRRRILLQALLEGLGLTGVAVVGALLLDMLMLSRGLIVSFRDLLESTGFDVRVTATEALPGMGPAVADAAATAEALRGLPELAAVVPVRFGGAAVE